MVLLITFLMMVIFTNVNTSSDMIKSTHINGNKSQQDLCHLNSRQKEQLINEEIKGLSNSFELPFAGLRSLIKSVNNLNSPVSYQRKLPVKSVCPIVTTPSIARSFEFLKLKIDKENLEHMQFTNSNKVVNKNNVQCKASKTTTRTSTVQSTLTTSTTATIPPIKTTTRVSYYCKHCCMYKLIHRDLWISRMYCTHCACRKKRRNQLQKQHHHQHQSKQYEQRDPKYLSHHQNKHILSTQHHIRRRRQVQESKPRKIRSTAMSKYEMEVIEELGLKDVYGTVVIKEECIEPRKDKGDNTISMCYSCKYIVKLPPNYFPQFHKHVTCGSHGHNYCLSFQGICVQIVRAEKIMIWNNLFDPTNFVEDTLPITAACSCEIIKNSYLHPFV